MLRVIGKVISNSLKYCPRESPVSLSAKPAGHDVLISVTDYGPGMVAEDLASAFIRGWQRVNAAARGDGAGLGLAIVSSLVKQEGGKVSLQSSAGSGSSVHIVMPQSSAA